jgi:hypothetical protein
MHSSTRSTLVVALVAACFLAGPRAHPVFRGDEAFPPEEFAAHRAKLIERIGEGVAVALGTPGPPGDMPFRQDSQCFYLTGVTVDRCRKSFDQQSVLWETSRVWVAS